MADTVLDSLRMRVESSLIGRAEKGSVLSNWSAYRQAVQQRLARETGADSSVLNESKSFQELDAIAAAASRGSPKLPLNAHTGLDAFVIFCCFVDVSQDICSLHKLRLLRQSLFNLVGPPWRIPLRPCSQNWLSVDLLEQMQETMLNLRRSL